MSALLLEAKAAPSTGSSAARSAGHRSPADPVIAVEPCLPADADAHRAAWEDLARRALERNVFCEPAFAIAAARRLTDDGKPVFLLIWDGRAPGRPRRLIGVVPVVAPHFALGTHQIRVWKSVFSGLATPLIDCDAAEEALDALFAWVGRTYPGVTGLMFPMIEKDGPFGRLLAGRTTRAGAVLREFGLHQRAVLPAGPSAGAFLDEALRGKKLKELRRQRRRLGEQGALAARSVTDRKGVRDAFEYVLALEAAGWKGERGTAMMQQAEVAAFARSAIRELAAARACRIDLIELDGRPIAAGIVLQSGDRAWYWKTAYDPSLARFSPGVQLALDLTLRQLGSRSVALTDSCAIEGHPMIDHLWSEKRGFVDLFVGVDARRSASALAFARRETIRRDLRRRAKSLLLKITRRHAS